MTKKSEQKSQTNFINGQSKKSDKFYSYKVPFDKKF